MFLEVPHYSVQVGYFREKESLLGFNGKYTHLRGDDNYYIYDDNGVMVNEFHRDTVEGSYRYGGQRNGVFAFRYKNTT